MLVWVFLLSALVTSAAFVMDIKLAIFDLDGTLLDTETLSTKAIEMVLEEIGVSGFDWALKKKLLGLRGPDWSAIVIDEMQIEGKISPEAMVNQWESNLGQLCPSVEKMSGADTLTARFESSGLRMAIATSSSSAQV